MSGLNTTSFSGSKGKNFKRAESGDLSKKQVDEISSDQMEGEIQLQLDQSEIHQDKRPFFKAILFMVPISFSFRSSFSLAHLELAK